MSPCGNTCIRDVELYSEGEDIFFDSFDYLDTSLEPGPSASYMVEKPEFELRKHPYEFWVKELSTVHDRRHKFLREAGFDKLFLPQLDTKAEVRDDVPQGKLELARILDASASPAKRADDDCISTKVLDAEKVTFVGNFCQNGVAEMLAEAGPNRNKAWQEVETEIGSRFVQPFLGKVEFSGVNEDKVLNAAKKLRRRWWRSLISKRNVGGVHQNGTFARNSDFPRSVVKKLTHENGKGVTEFHMLQECIAHKGLIRSMEFSPCGMFLATGGEDCAVRIWKVQEIEVPGNCHGSSTLSGGSEKSKTGRKCFNCSAFISPHDVLRLDEVPLHEYLGHTSEILDLSWSTSNFLLSASKDKTVRMWRIGFDSCVEVFHHSNYVTCIQINPVDDGYFISGSLDGKVRIWAVDESRVVNWVDSKDIITAISYQTDGQGFVVGTLSGNCRFYVHSAYNLACYLGIDNNLELDRQLFVCGKKKSGKRITGLQFCPGDSNKIMITSSDSKVQIFNAFDLVQKFGGSGRSKSHGTASFTDDGKHIVFVGDNSKICIRDNSAIPSSKIMKLVCPCEHFFSEGVTVAVPRPSIGKREASVHRNSPHSSVPVEYGCKNHPTFSIASCFRGNSVTWPEDKLPVMPEFSELGSQPESLMATSSLFIVTGSCNGMIRLFNYTRLPGKFC